MMEDEGAIFLVQVLVEAQPWLGRREHALKGRLPLGQRFAPHVGPVELDQVECPHENAVVSIPSPDQFKTSDPVIAAGDGFAIDNTGPGAQPRKGLGNQGETRRQIVARTAVELHPLAILARDAPETVVLDLVQPERAARRLRG